MDVSALLVTSEYPPDIGGIGSHVSELARVLPAEAVNVEVVNPRDIWQPKIKDEQGNFSLVRPALIKAKPFYDVMLHHWLSRRLRRARFDIVHVHGMRPLAATRRLPARTIFTNHTTGFLARLNASPARKQRTARLLDHIDYLVAPSAERVEAARAFGYTRPAIMIPNGVDGGRFHPGASPLRAKWGLAESDVVILLARRLVEKNGIVDFAHAVRLLKPASFRVVVAGEGPERAKMVAILRDANLLDRVLFLGSVQNCDMPPVYRAADLSVLPSLAEATSISGLEAMATALPLVGTRVGGIPAIIADGTTGLLVDPAQPQALAAALDTLIADRALRMRFGAAARVRTEREFSWTTIARRTVEIYRACLAGRAVSDAPSRRANVRSAESLPGGGVTAL